MQRTVALGSGTKVKVREPALVPAESIWDDDHQRTSTPVKRKLQEAFFKGDKKILAEVVYVGSDSLRERLKAKGQVKVQLRDPAGSSIVVTAPVGLLCAR